MAGKVENLTRWDSDRLIDRDVWIAAGRQGVLGLAVPEEFGGAGQSDDYRFRNVVLEELAKAKWWATDVQNRLIDTCLQLHGGYGYMIEYPVARAFQDALVQRIFGGANEIMKHIIGRDMVGQAPRR